MYAILEKRAFCKRLILVKKCPYCGALLHDGDRFCLHCMKLLFSPRTLPLYGKRRYSVFLIFLLLSLILPMLVLSGLYLHVSPDDAADASVSYTHLDVYKRQLKNNENRFLWALAVFEGNVVAGSM